MNRAIARRTAFEGKADAEQFLALVQEAAEKGDIEVHAYSLMATHFHLLARSPKGRISAAMRQIQLGYVRYFNRRRRRDGPLFRGRFRSRLVDTLAYRRVLVSYIDCNPVKARVVADAAHYPYGSAFWYGHGDEGPPWLTRTWVESEVRRCGGRERYRAADYTRCFPARLPDAVVEWVERRIERRGTPGEDELANLLEAAPEEVRDWAVRKALLADGTRPGLPIVPPESVALAFALHPLPPASAGAPATIDGHRDARRTLRAGLLRDLCGCSYEEIGRRLGRSRGSVWEDIRAHHRAVIADPGYSAVASALIETALDQTREALAARGL